MFKSVYDDDFRLLDIPESASRRPRADLGLSQLQSLKWNPKPENPNILVLWFGNKFSSEIDSDSVMAFLRLLMSTAKLPSQFQRSFKI